MSLLHPRPRKDDPRCSCVEGQYQCGFCRGIERQKIWNRMSEKDRAYDRYVDPNNSRTLDAGRDVDLDRYEAGCSCHITPPCSYCTRETDDDDELPSNEGGDRMAETLIRACSPPTEDFVGELAKLADVLANIRADTPDPTCPKIDRILGEVKEPRRTADRLAVKGATDNEELAEFANEVDRCLWTLPDILEELRNDNAQLRDGVHHLGSFCHEASAMLRKAIAEIARLNDGGTP